MRHRWSTPIASTLTAILSATALAAQQPPVAAAQAVPAPVLAYQGRLLEATLPVTGTRSFTFAILDSSGAELWHSTAQQVSVNSGLYGVELGAAPMPVIPTSVLAQANLKLRVVVSGIALSPDTDLVPALQARSAFEVSGDFAGDVGGTQNAITLLRLQGIPLDLTTAVPTSGQTLIYNGTKWIPGTVAVTTGPMGPQGATGQQGPIGPQGIQGPVGLTGNTGPAGASPFTLNGSDAVYTAGSLAVGVGVTLPQASALLDLTSTTKGFLPPRMTAVQRAAIVTPVAGLMVYQTDGTSGLYQHDGSAWAPVIPLGGNGSVTSVTTSGPLTGGPITGSGTIGITKATASGDGYLAAADFAIFLGKGSGTVTSLSGSGGTTGLTLGGGPIVTSGTLTLGGTLAVANGGTGLTVAGTSGNVLTSNGTSWTSAAVNTTIGSLNGNTKGGSGALLNNSAGTDNTAFGNDALNLNTSSTRNSAFGRSALFFNIGYDNTATGMKALYSNTSGWANTASGVLALLSNTTGYNNTATGSYALQNNTTGYFNNASGFFALNSNTTGINNTALGETALGGNTTGNHNTAVGYKAGMFLTTGSYNIFIGNAGVGDEGNTIRIGDSNQTRTFISGIRGAIPGAGNGIAVMIDSNGQLGTTFSSIRYKEDVNDMSDLTSRIFSLRPVTFRYKAQPSAVHFGLIAEEVDQVMPELVVRGKDGQIETVAYHELPAMLLNELQKEHKVNATQAQEIGDLKAENAALKERLARIEAALGIK